MVKEKRVSEDWILKNFRRMVREEKSEAVIARLIANTLRKKRPNNLIQIARDIRRAQNHLGSLRAVSDTLGISSDMLRQFLSVEQLCPAVRKLVEKREIDLVNIVYYIRNFNPKAQQVIAKEVVAGRLSANDIRVLAPLQKSFPKLNIQKLISRVQKSKDIKVYVAYFLIPNVLKDTVVLKRLESIVGKSQIVSFGVKNQVATLKLTSVGYKRIKEASRKSGLSLREFVNTLLKKENFGNE